MYGQPQSPDPWAEVQPIPPHLSAIGYSGDDDAPSGAVAVGAVLALAASVVAFAVGYMAGVWGWL